MLKKVSVRDLKLGDRVRVSEHEATSVERFEEGRRENS